MSSWGIFLVLSAIMCSAIVPSRQFRKMRLTLIFRFRVNLNLLALFLLFRNIGLNLPSRLNNWLNFRNKSSPLVLTGFPNNDIWLWKAVSIDGKLLLHHWRKVTLIDLKSLNRLCLGLMDMLTVWKRVGLTGLDLNSCCFIGFIRGYHVSSLTKLREIGVCFLINNQYRNLLYLAMVEHELRDSHPSLIFSVEP